MFWERFTSLCERVGKFPSNVTGEVGLSNSVATGWGGGSVPQKKSLALLSNYFLVSEDYLLGKSDVLGRNVAFEIEPNDYPPNIKGVIANNLSHMRQQSGKPRRDLGDEKAVQDAEERGMLPSLNTLEIWADAIGVTLDELYGGYSYLLHDDSAKSEDLRIALFGGDTEVTDAMWAEAIAYARFVAAREANKK